MGDNSLDEKRIQQVMEIEKQADAIYAAAIKEAADLPSQAEKEAQALIEKARADAEEEARKLVAMAQTGDESSRISSDADEKVHQIESMAAMNFDRAVAYVLARVVGREGA